jgi:hypothetical protein
MNMKIQSLPRRLAELVVHCVLALSVSLINSPIALGQSDKPTTASASAKASFRIEPLVRRFKARRGEIVPFSFEVTATGKDMEIVIAPTSMRQEENGLILPREDAVEGQGLRLLSPLEFKLKSGESHTIKGEVEVPLSKSNFLSFGILVKDSGQLKDNPDEDTKPGDTRAAIRFVTQYLLRIDVETGVKDFAELQRVTLEKGTIQSINGYPIAQLYLNNPTNFAFECTVQGTIESSQTRRPQPFYLGLPSRRELAVDQRNLVRVLPKSRLRLEANVESLMFPGHQALKVKLSSGSHTIQEQSFDVSVEPGQYKGLEAKLAFVGNQLSIEPAQIELSMVGRSPRTRMLIFHNNSNTTRSVSLSTQTLNGEPMTGLKLSSDTFEIKPGRAKSIRMIIENSSTQESLYGKLLVSLAGQDGEPDLTKALPVALIYSSPALPDVDAGELRTIESNGHTWFELPVTNRSEGYVPVHAGLQVTSRKGRSMSFADGFGQWITPGETRVLRFVPAEPLAADDYQLKLEVKTVERAEPISKTKFITLSAPADESVSSLDGEPTTSNLFER